MHSTSTFSLVLKRSSVHVRVAVADTTALAWCQLAPILQYSSGAAAAADTLSGPAIARQKQRRHAVRLIQRSVHTNNDQVADLTPQGFGSLGQQCVQCA